MVPVAEARAAILLRHATVSPHLSLLRAWQLGAAAAAPSATVPARGGTGRSGRVRVLPQRSYHSLSCKEHSNSQAEAVRHALACLHAAAQCGGLLLGLRDLFCVPGKLLLMEVLKFLCTCRWCAHASGQQGAGDEGPVSRWAQGIGASKRATRRPGWNPGTCRAAVGANNRSGPRPLLGHGGAPSFGRLISSPASRAPWAQCSAPRPHQLVQGLIEPSLQFAHKRQQHGVSGDVGPCPTLRRHSMAPSAIPWPPKDITQPARVSTAWSPPA